MVAFSTRSQRVTETRLLPGGVFEDDALLLRLAARSRFTEPGYPRPADQINSDDLAFEVARLVDSATWDL
jgi:hypothetical protein